VWEVVRDLNGDKAQGPDGFTIAFFLRCWEVMKEDIMAVFKELHSRQKFVKNINATYQKRHKF
jgi:hypothetical protein